MKGRIGHYRTHKTASENYKTYVPVKLPITIDVDCLQKDLDATNIALGKLSECAQWVPDLSLFLYMYIRKEAVLSSQIEGTQSSLNDLLLFENKAKPEVSLDDVQEVSNYVKSIYYGLDRIKNGFVLSLRLLKEMHAILLKGTRGQHCMPGEFRTSQNWIGGTRPGNAFFVPPTPEDMKDALYNLEEFLHNDRIPLLIRIGIAHVQFETIHPFLDGNGRMGRLLITFMLCNFGLLQTPILYPSLYFKEHRTEYYQRLNDVRSSGEWDSWLKFFLEGIKTTALQAVEKIHQIHQSFADCERKIASMGRGKFSCQKVFEYLKKVPQVTVPQVAKTLSLTAPTARKVLQYMESADILKETSGKLRDKVYVFDRYMKILE